MKRRTRLAAGVTTSMALLAFTLPARSQEVVTDPLVEVTVIEQLAEDIQATADRAADYAKQVEIYVELVNTYATAVQNTVAIPQDAINRVTALYTRTQMLATQAAAIAGPDGTIMQRLGMLRSVGRQGGQLPGGIRASAAFWNAQREQQMDENARLLGLENDRRLTMDDVLGSAQTAAATAIGQMQAIQAQSQVTAASAMQLQAMNDQLAFMQQYQVEKDETEAAKERLFQEYANGEQFELGRGQGF